VRATDSILELADDPMKNMLLSEFMHLSDRILGVPKTKSHLGPVLNETSSNGVFTGNSRPIASDDWSILTKKSTVCLHKKVARPMIKKTYPQARQPNLS